MIVVQTEEKAAPGTEKRVKMASVDLKKYGTDIKNASNEVMNDKTETDWALFGYEGQTNVVKVMATGDGGLDELIEDFNPNKIQYALLKVEDPKTSLPKYVLINWQVIRPNLLYSLRFQEPLRCFRASPPQVCGKVPVRCTSETWRDLSQGII